MPVNTLGPTGMVAQSMSVPVATQGMFEGGMKLELQGMDGRKKGGGPRIFQISPAVNGKTLWDLNTDGTLTRLVTAANTQSTVTATPLSTFSAQVSAWGQGGTASNGGYVKATVLFLVGTPYVLTCGRGPGAGGIGDNGAAYWGGGYTGIFKNVVSQANAVLIAAGGGGSPTDYPSTPAGDGGYPSGAAGSGFNVPDGGTQTSGGAHNGGPESVNGTSGLALQGGRGADRTTSGLGWGGGGGGGGGYFGGGGGPGGGSYRGGGAGGSSYVSNDAQISTTSFSQGASDPKRTDSAGTNYAGLLAIY